MGFNKGTQSWRLKQEIPLNNGVIMSQTHTYVKQAYWRKIR